MNRMIRAGLLATAVVLLACSNNSLSSSGVTDHSDAIAAGNAEGWVAVQQEDGFHVLSAVTGTPHPTLAPIAVDQVAWSADGSVLVTLAGGALRSGAISAWRSAGTGTPLATGVEHAALSPDGRYVAYTTGSTVNLLRLAASSVATSIADGGVLGGWWSAPGLSQPTVIVEQGGTVSAIGLQGSARPLFQGQSPAPSPQGAAIAFERGGRLLVWSPTRGEVDLGAWPEGGSVLWSPLGDRLAIEGSGEISIVDLAGASTAVGLGTGAAWAREGTELFVARDGQVIRWSTSGDTMIANGASASPQPLPREAPALPASLSLVQVFPDLSIDQMSSMRWEAGAGVYLITAKTGELWSVTPGGVATKVLDLSGQTYTWYEQGLLGAILRPGYDGAGDLYLYHATGGYPTFEEAQTETPPEDPRAMVLTQFAASGEGETFSVDAESAEIVIDLPGMTDWKIANHNGGGMAFGWDGYLYLGVGDYGTSANADDIQSMLGKILRIDVQGGTYSVPANPTLPAGAPAEAYALGVRNPYYLTVAPETGEIWFADPGDSNNEEVNVLAPGADYGWPTFEGTHCSEIRPCVGTQWTPPVTEYRHAEYPGAICAFVAGGFVYAGEAIPDLRGAYLHGEGCEGILFAHRPATPLPQEAAYDLGDTLGRTYGTIVSIFEGHDGEAYIIQFVPGRIWKVQAP